MIREFRHVALARFLHRDNRQIRTKRGQKRHPWNNDAQPMSPASCVRTHRVLIGLLSVIPLLAFGQTVGVPVGGEIPLTHGLSGDQVLPSVAIGASGGFVVWQDNATDLAGLGVGARRLDAGLNPVGEKFQVNVFPGGDQENARVALLNNGGAAFVWQGGRAGNQAVYARLANSDGSFATGDILVSDASLSRKTMVLTNWPMIRNNKARNMRQRFRHVVENRHEFAIDPAVTVLADGSIVVAYAGHRRFVTNSWTLTTDIRWDDPRQRFITNTYRQPFSISLRPMQDVYFQRLSADGSKIGGETAANVFRDYNQQSPSIAALPNGGFALCWISELPVENVAATPTPQNRANTSQIQPRGGRVDVYGRLFGSDGAPIGAEWRINTTNLPCNTPSVIAIAGGFTVAWSQRDIERQNGWDVYYRTFDLNGAATSSALRGNTNIYGDQFRASITAVGERQLLVWSSMGQDGSWEGVYARWLQSGNTISDEFRVNTTTHLRQIQPVASGSDTRVAVVWASYAFESGFDLFMQGYRLP